MSPLPPEFLEKSNITICTGVIELTLDSGDIARLEFGKGLWFEKRMNKSLIKPN